MVGEGREGVSPPFQSYFDYCNQGDYDKLLALTEWNLDINEQHQ